jgi:hypothetical protein
MLAKQVGRLIDTPDSLCARVLQAKYYPDGNILTAGPKAGSSLTWQSILVGVTTFKRGYIWRIGNGEKINIWRDPWIPSSPSRKILSPRGGVIYTKVCELINPVTNQWDEELLRSIFADIDVRRILQIPLHSHGLEDFIAWGPTSHGRYTVRSGYYLQWRHQFGPSAPQLALPGSSATNPVWKILWKIKVPSKVKIFIWRALHDIVPLKCILANRHVGTSASCPICGVGPEDVLHLLFLFPPATQLWEAIGILDIITDAVHIDRSGSVVLEALLRRQENSLQGFENGGLKETIMVTCWYLLVFMVDKKKAHAQ